MSQKPLSSLKDLLPRIPVPLVFLVIYLIFRSLVHAQSADLGPASFSSNWGGTTSLKNTHRQQLVMLQRSPSSETTMPPRSADSYEGQSHAESSAPAPAPSHVPLSVPGFASLPEPTVPGNRAKLRHGIAYAPENVPLNVKKAIWATNTLLRKPYVWGGGHGSFFDTGYDCSGTVSFALHYAGLLSAPTDSRSLMSFGAPGSGRWMTIYARNGHTWMVIAGLRLDTTGFYGDEGPRWRTDGRAPWGFEARHPVGL